MTRRALVLGIGSPIISDDAVGIRVIEGLRSLNLDGVDVKEVSSSGLDLIELMLDYDTVVIVDAIITSEYPVGTVLQLEEKDFVLSVHGANPHDVNIATTIELGRRLQPNRMPKRIAFVAVEVADTWTISYNMTPEVEAAIPETMNRVI
ncbi:MAG: hydrogenase maturation protease, partial [Methanomassiliicoccales archaeon]|nr:hydrogenase maturation protease [Methanomassiliicoccales archaeon]